MNISDHRPRSVHYLRSKIMKKFGKTKRANLKISANENPRLMQKKKIIPCLPTISATCSELGTGTHSVIFCDFLDLVSSRPIVLRGLSRGPKSEGLSGSDTAAAESGKRSMESSYAS